MRTLDRCFIDGEWVRAQGEVSSAVVNPATDDVIATVTHASVADVDAAVAAAARAREGWAETPVAARLDVLRKLAREMEAATNDLANCITSEMGAPLAFSRAAQVGMPIRNLSITIDAMAAFEDERIGSSLVMRAPAGVVGAVTPWNFPLHQIIAKAAPALAAGCAIVLKPSETTPLNAMMLTEMMERAGLPAGVFNLVFGDGAIGAALARHPGIDVISFTGSTRAGKAVAAAAAQNLTRCALELGGKSANIVLDDADMDRAIPTALGQCFINSGQICAALSRLLVPHSMLDEVKQRAAAAAVAWSVGDPLDPATRLGPLATKAHQARVQGFVAQALRDGARALVGGATPFHFSRGAYVAPTILTDAAPDAPIAREEVFGPVLLISGYADEADAVRQANDSAYGLSGGVWSRDGARALAVARRMRTGQVLINGANLDLNAPFGGVKQSGYGREYGRYGLEEFFSLKSVLGVPENGAV